MIEINLQYRWDKYYHYYCQLVCLTPFCAKYRQLALIDPATVF